MPKSAPHFFRSRKESGEDSWISTSDLMAGLMMVFLFIAIAYIENVTRTQQHVGEIVDTWIETEEAIARALLNEFENDFEKWGVDENEVRESLVVTFDSPDIQFERGSAEIPIRFQSILEDFFPRYLKTMKPYFEKIEEIRIEGHTSSEWNAHTLLKKYFNNMELSQDRTRTVLEFCLNLSGVAEFESWSIKHVTANGMSSSNLKFLNPEGKTEDKIKSRRVEFRIRTNATEQFRMIERELGYEN